MKAIGFNRPLPVSNPEALLDIELPEPELRPHDILVAVQAVSVNPADVKVRAAHTPAAGQYRVLGYDAAGIVQAVGSEVRHFKVGDEVYYAGAINRQGSNAQLQAVDARIAAKKPRSLDFAQAAALPLTAITAWETLFDRLDVNKPVAGGANVLLLIGGAGGVGSLAIQLLKKRTDIQVIATASRPESRAWVKELGADFVINHHENMAEQVAALNIGAPSFVFSTNHTDCHLPQIVELIAPQGLDKLREYVKQAGSTPVVAIGGIDLNNAEDVLATGVSSLAVVRAVTEAENPEAVVKAFQALWEE